MINWIKKKIKWFLIAIGIVGIATASVLSLPESEISADEINIDGRIVEMAFTDNNDNETLIIKAEKETINGLGTAETIFSITNNAKSQNVTIALSFLKAKITEAYVHNGTSEVEIDVPDYGIEEYPVITATSSELRTRTIQTGTHKETVRRTDWVDLSLGKTKLTAIDRKPIGDNKVGDVFSIYIKNGETKYFKAKIEFPLLPISGEKFNIEALGELGAYGIYDPTVHFSEDFEDCDAGALISNAGCTGWVAEAGWGTDITRETLSQGAGTYSVGDDSTGDDAAKQIITAVTDDVAEGTTLTWYTRWAGSSETSMFIYDGATILMYVSGRGATSNINLNTTVDIATGLSTNTWYKITCEWDFDGANADKYRCNVDDGSWTAWTVFYSSATAQSFDTILIHQQGTAYGYYDTILLSTPDVAAAPTPIKQEIIHYME